MVGMKASVAAEVGCSCTRALQLSSRMVAPGQRLWRALPGALHLAEVSAWL